MTIVITPSSGKLVNVADSVTGKTATNSFVQILPFSNTDMVVAVGNARLHATHVEMTVVSSTITPPITTPTESPDKTIITKPGGPSIIDSHGTMWNIVAAGARGNQITADGAVQVGTNHVDQLVYVGKTVWQNAYGVWWSKSALGQQWLPTAGTSVSPLTAPPVVMPPVVVPPVVVPPPGGITSPVDMSGWKLSWHDDFPGTSVSGDWHKYGTGKSGTPPIMFNNDGMSVNNGFFGKIWKDSNGQWFGPGLNTTQGFTPPYRVEMKVLVPKAAGVAPYFLMWPTNNQWPPEIDIAEYPGNGDKVMMTLHDMHNTNGGLSDFFDVDRSTWHTLTMELANSGIRRWVNGKEQPTNANWNAHNDITMAMSPGIGAVAFPPGSGGAGWFGGTDSSTPNPYEFQVAYVAVYKPV